MNDANLNLDLVPDDLGPPYEKCADCGQTSKTWTPDGQICICPDCHDKRSAADLKRLRELANEPDAAAPLDRVAPPPFSPGESPIRTAPLPVEPPGTEFDVRVYHQGWHGSGCFAEMLHVTPENYVRHTDTVITVRESYQDQDGGDRMGESDYYTDLDAYAAHENKWFNEHMAEVTERHVLTRLQIAELKAKYGTKA
jgi:hypothetical protein